YALSRDILGRVVEKNQTMNSVSSLYEDDFDNSVRLEQVKLDSVVVSTYGYDSNSNRNSGIINRTTTSATYDDQDRLNSYNVYEYNANGELQGKTNSLLSQTTSYSYDSLGNLREVVLPSTDEITYEVDGLNRRIGKKINGVLEKRWVYMDQLRIAGELNSSGL